MIILISIVLPTVLAIIIGLLIHRFWIRDSKVEITSLNVFGIRISGTALGNVTVLFIIIGVFWILHPAFDNILSFYKKDQTDKKLDIILEYLEDVNRQSEGFWFSDDNKDLAINAVKRVAGEDSPESARAIDELLAESDTEPAIMILENYAKRTLEEYINVNKEIASLAYLKSDYVRAEVAANNILLLIPEDMYALNIWGMVLRRLGDLHSAEGTFKKMHDISENAGNKQWLAIACSNLGNCYYVREDFDGAKELYEKSYSLNKELLRDNGMATDYCNLGCIYRQKGELDIAESMFDKALKLEEQLGRTRGKADNYSNLGHIYVDRGNFLDAENMYLQALELYQSIDCTQGIADENRNLGLTYQNLAQSERSNQEKRTYYDKAEKCYQNALENHISLSDEYGIAIDYLNLGQLSGIRENYDEAEIKLENAIGRFEKLQKKIPLAKCYFNLGLVFFYRGDNENAKNNLITAMEIYKSILGNDNTPRISVEIASCFDFLCQVDQKDEEWQSAKENCIKALDYFKQANNFIKVREMEKRLDSLEDKI